MWMVGRTLASGTVHWQIAFGASTLDPDLGLGAAFASDHEFISKRKQ
jgi:hypothetical protein